MTGPQPVPVTRETMGGSVIDSARISVMAAMFMIPEEPPPVIVTSEAEEPMPSVHDCLEQAMHWLDMARALTVQKGAPVTSLHTVEKPSSLVMP